MPNKLEFELTVNNDRLKDICKRPVDWYWRKYADNVIEEDGRKCIYINNDSNVLAVAHLDTVVDVRKTFNFNPYTRNNTRIIKCPALDDRLGVYIILDMLPEGLGEGWADILLTTDEEIGKSTVDIFVDKYKDDHAYNWIVEFDRRGGKLLKSEDAVLYSYLIDSKEFKEALKDSGFTDVSRGSYTDIAGMQDLGVKGFNVAVGYLNNHSTKALMYPVQTEYAVSNFMHFYRANKDTKFEHTKAKVYQSTYQHNYGYGTQRYLPYSKEVPVNTGLSATRSMFKGGDIVYNFTHTVSNRSLYVISEVYEYADDKFRYDIEAVDGVYNMHRLEEKNLQQADDVCSICLRRKVSTWMYYDELGTFFLCDFCRTHIMDGYAMCEECFDTFVPDEFTSGAAWGATCDKCTREQNLRPGDVVVFGCSKDEVVKGVPFLVNGIIGKTDNVSLWDGETVYNNNGEGYSTSMLRPLRYGVTVETFDKEYSDRAWGAKIKEMEHEYS